jgi:hypothetical protein
MRRSSRIPPGKLKESHRQIRAALSETYACEIASQAENAGIAGPRAKPTFHRPSPHTAITNGRPCAYQSSSNGFRLTVAGTGFEFTISGL